MEMNKENAFGRFEPFPWLNITYKVSDHIQCVQKIQKHIRSLYFLRYINPFDDENIYSARLSLPKTMSISMTRPATVFSSHISTVIIQKSIIIFFFFCE